MTTTEKKQSDMQRFAALRSEERKKKEIRPPKMVSDKDDSSDSDDDWLDDEQWYCEKKAQWTNRIEISSAMRGNFKEMNALLKSHVDAKKEVLCARAPSCFSLVIF